MALHVCAYVRACVRACARMVKKEILFAPVTFAAPAEAAS